MEEQLHVAADRERGSRCSCTNCRFQPQLPLSLNRNLGESVVPVAAGRRSSVGGNSRQRRRGRRTQVFGFGGIKQPGLGALISAVVLVLLLSRIFHRDPASTEKPLKQACAPRISNSFSLVMVQIVLIK